VNDLTVALDALADRLELDHSLRDQADGLPDDEPLCLLVGFLGSDRPANNPTPLLIRGRMAALVSTVASLVV
jgi:hypothetical protein